MKIVLLGGAGLMGRATARDLLAQSPTVDVVLADIDRAAAERVAADVRRDVPSARGRLVAATVDASSVPAVATLIRGAGAVINSAQYYFNLPVMEAALAERVPYVDLGGLYHTTRLQLPLGPAFEAAGVTAIVGIGSTPGVTNVQARHAATLLDTIESIHFYCGNTPNPDSPFAWGYSIHTILDEVTKPPIVFRAGEHRELEPLAEPDTFRFLDPIGEREVHHSLHSELATIPGAFAGHGVYDVSFMLNYFGYTPRALRRLKALADAGLSSVEPLDVLDRGPRGGLASVRPRDVLVGALAREGRRAADEARARGEDPDAFVIDHEEVVTVVHGRRAGVPTTIRVDTMAVGRTDWRMAGGVLLTASPPGIVATWLADGSLRLPGVHAPEAAIDPARLFAALEARDMHTTIAVDA